MKSALLVILITLFSADSLAAQEWGSITPPAGPAPAARTLAAAIYDPAAHAMVVFGGQNDVGARFNDVWSFDLASEQWSDITPATGPAPVGRITPAMVYDGDRHQILMFSGQAAGGGVFLNDTWAFDLANGSWTEFMPASPIPAIRYGVGSCYDEVGKTQVTFAGFTFQGRFDDTWRFDPVSESWTDVTPASGSPLERCLHGAAYDSRERRMIIYGGQNGGPLGDVWACDLAAGVWSELTPASGPDPRWFTVLEYDRANHRLTMFGGARGALGLANDVWVFDLWADEWVALSPEGTAPAARSGAASCFVPSEDRIVVFGGSTGTVQSDVWTLNDLSDTRTSQPPVTGTVLYQNAPNPFNPTTVIRYDLAASGSVSLAIYDPAGRKVRTLVRETLTAGPRETTWDGRDDAGDPVASGVYFYRLEADGARQSRKLVIIR